MIKRALPTGLFLKYSGLLATFWLVSIVTISIFAFSSKPTFDSSIMSLLPHSQQIPLVQQATEQSSSRFSKRVLLLVSGDDQKQLLEAVEQTAKLAQDIVYIDNVQYQVDANALDNFEEEMFGYRFVTLDKDLQTRLAQNDTSALVQESVSNVLSPVGVRADLVSDPFGFFIKLGLRQTSDLNIQVEHSYLKVTGADKPTYMLLLNLNDSPFSLDVQDTIMRFLSSLDETLSKGNIELSISGMIVHAAAGARQAKNEISTIGIGSLLGVLVLLLFVFRRVKPLLLVFVPLSVGILNAISGALLIFGELHLITIAFGAGLVGVSIDYSLHYLCERQQSSNSNTLKRIVSGLSLGLFSSVMAYSVQLFAPFPGIQQMAVFSIIGLVSSWLSVVLILPMFTRKDSLSELPLAEVLSRYTNFLPRVAGNAKLTFFLGACACIGVVTILMGKSVSDIRLLQTSPPELMAQEKHIQTLLGSTNNTQFLLFTGHSIQDVLRKEEAILPAISAKVENGDLPKFQSLSQHVPSIDTQKAQFSLVNALYDQQLSTFYGMLGIDQAFSNKAYNALKAQASNFIRPEQWANLAISDGWRDLLVSTKEASSASMLRFTQPLNEEQVTMIQRIVSTQNDILYVDQVKDISDLMAEYAAQVSRLIIFAYLLLSGVLLLRYKAAFVSIALPTFMATIIALAAVTFIAGGINMFHLLASILVLGIGLDMGIFMHESDHEGHTWLAVSLSSLTSLLAFGLLALSATPVLYHFGITVLIGLTLVWLITALMRPSKSEGEQHLHINPPKASTKLFKEHEL
ncbi:MMPL family transporter [Agaribacter marinus]|uniref:Membrane protein n=1 Tax=Agaribacter marinus TaxID=1431249 RepID=A0AA37WI97_9ALTE|nr:MMPL family transporter [Agaribacter marinus]GLR70743.1 membrane protein [Agaribacter marinus]